MTIRNPDQAMSPKQREQYRRASRPIESATAARRELLETSDQIEALGKRRLAAQRQYREDSSIAGGRFITDEMREAARKSAEEPLSEAEAQIRREITILQRRAQSITVQLRDAAETPSLANLEPEVLGAASQMVPILASQLANLSLRELAKRVRAAQVRGDQAEVFAYATVARSHLAERQTSPKSGDSDSDFYAAQDIVSGISSAFRDSSLDSVIRHADEVVGEVGSFARQILSDKSERGDNDPYGFLEGVA